MLRVLAVGLLAANLLYFGWTLGWLDDWFGIRAEGDREPQRISRQVRPELIELSPVAASASAQEAASAASAAEPVTAAIAAASASASAPAPASSTPSAPAAAVTSARPATEPAKAAQAAQVAAPASTGTKQGEAALACLEAGPFSAADVAAAETTLRSAWPDGAWTQRKVAGATEWMIYMGPYPDDAWVERKKAELSRIRGGIPYEVVESTPMLGRGISLGRFGSQAEAEKRLTELRPRGIRTARVAKSAEGPARTVLRIGGADSAVAARLAAVKWPNGVRTGFAACATQ